MPLFNVFHFFPRVTTRFITKANYYTSFPTSCLIEASAIPICPFNVAVSHFDYSGGLNKFHPPRPYWYEDLYASLFNIQYPSFDVNGLRGKNVLPYFEGKDSGDWNWHSKSIVEVIGLDPDRNIENRARSSATSAGFPPSKFKFIHGVGEAIPLSDASVDAVVGTLVLCSVKDVDVTLKEIKRVLRPGGLYVFVEHVGAKDRKMLRIVQTVLNPVSKKFCGWCHLNRDIGGNICRAGFSSVEQNMAYVTSSELRNPLENPIVYGMAYK